LSLSFAHHLSGGGGVLRKCSSPLRGLPRHPRNNYVFYDEARIAGPFRPRSPRNQEPPSCTAPLFLSRCSSSVCMTTRRHTLYILAYSCFFESLISFLSTGIGARGCSPLAGFSFVCFVFALVCRLSESERDAFSAY